MTSQISLLEGAIADWGITGNKKAIFLLSLMAGFYWKVLKNGRIYSFLYVQD